MVENFSEEKFLGLQPTDSSIKKLLSKKKVFISFGLVNFFIFHWAIYRLWFFLYDTQNRFHYSSLSLTLLVNLILLIFFSSPHSFLLKSHIKTKILRYIPTGLYYSFYSLHACIFILLMDYFWGNINFNIYRVSEDYLTYFNVMYLLSWILMFWSMYSVGLFKQSGIEDWWKTLKHEKLTHHLDQNGPYQFCRHPIYLSFIGMLWTTPYMTADHLLLSLFWTLYIVIGVYLKEKRLRHNHHYKEYAHNVPLFPFVPLSMDRKMSRLIWREL